MFLTQETNLKATNHDPVKYFAYFEDKNADVFAGQWIPTDPELWKDENCRDFLAERR